MPAPASGHHLLSKRLAQFTRMLPRLNEGDPRALRRTRVASRRLRAVLPVLPIDASVTQTLGRRLRQVTRQLGMVRTVDMLLMLVDELRCSGRFGGSGLERIAAALQQERADTWRKVRAKLSAGQLRG